MSEHESETTALNGLEQSYSSTTDLLHEVAIPANIVSVICSLWLGTFLSAADTTIVTTTANTIASNMNGNELLAWVATSYLITNTIFQPLVGRLSDVFGRKTVLLIAQFWFALGCLWCSLSTSVLQFAIGRAIAGIGGGGMSALSSIITTDIVPLRLRGVYQGYANLVYAVGQFSGPVIGSAFLSWNEDLGWRWMFGIQVPFVIVAGFLVTKNVHDYREDQQAEINSKRFTIENLKKIDLPGSALLSCIIVSILMLFSSENSTNVYLWLVLIFLSSIAFYLVEKYFMTVHVIPRETFQGLLRVTALIVFSGAGMIYIINYLLPLYLQIIQDFSQLQLGIFNSFCVFSGAAGSLLAGAFLKHEEKVKPEVVVQNSITLSIYCTISFFIGSLICLVGISQFKPSIEREDINYLQISIILIGNMIASVGYGAFLVALLILVVAKVGVKHQATVTGMNYMFRSMGQSTCVGLSLNIYKNILTSELKEYFGKKDRDISLINKLLDSSFFIREGLPLIYVKKVLKIYRSSITDALLLGFLLSSVALGLSILLKLYSTKKSSL